MKRWDKTLLMIYQVIVANIYQLIVGILLVLAMFFTCYIDIDEKTYFVVDSAGKNIISLILLMIVLCLLSRSTRIQEFCSKIESDGKLFRKCRRILLFTIFGISVFWLLATQYTPGSEIRIILCLQLTDIFRKMYISWDMYGFAICFPS